ncbi:hypothetical protein CW304_21155 [Bacillus sp. UFRGS-B20]|nr:hypothetical protein CW304_21155 [Bacillus sp. UFRGS-B20]
MLGVVFSICSVACFSALIFHFNARICCVQNFQDIYNLLQILLPQVHIAWHNERSTSLYSISLLYL